MASQLDSIIQVGHDVTAHKYHSIATGVAFFYDYLLTLPDEVKYIWPSKKSQWTFWLFITNRYFPVTWQIWQIGVAYISQSPLNTKICEKTVWYPLLVFVVCTFLAQVVLTIRNYAVAPRNRAAAITVGFAMITACQLVLGICMITLGGIKGARPQLPIPFDAYHLCVYVQFKPLEIAYTGTSLLFDFLTFSLIIYQAKGWKELVSSRGPRNSTGDRTRGDVVNREDSEHKTRTIWETIERDGTLYFLVIFTSHLVLVLTLNFARESMQLLPAPAILVYLPVMISRILLSLRKAADPRGGSLSATGISTLKFAHPQRDSNGEEDDTTLDTFSMR